MLVFCDNRREQLWAIRESFFEYMPKGVKQAMTRREHCRRAELLAMCLWNTKAIESGTRQAR